MNKRVCGICIGLWLSSSQVVVASEAQSLPELITSAYRYDGEYLSTIQSLKADQLIYEQALAVLLPQVDASVAYSENNYLQKQEHQGA